MSFVDIKLVKQLKDVVQEVSRKKCKNAVSQMFSIESALIKNTLLSWFNKKIKSQNLQSDIDIKNKYEKKNVHYSGTKTFFTICKFPLKIDPVGLHVPNSEMSYRDFFIRNKHIFFRNIYLKSSCQNLRKFLH